MEYHANTNKKQEQSYAIEVIYRNTIIGIKCNSVKLITAGK